ncbi:MAG: glycosyltransferase family 1 protein [Nitrospinae bacterium]|nr:glycosyltransferase family 1 protein [Nitrospinota bacterium]
MRIGVDARMISMGGIGTYLRSLLGGLNRRDDDVEYVVFLQERDMDSCARLGSSFRRVVCTASPYSLAEQARLPRLLGRERLDLIHHPHYFTPFFGKTPMVATIHDLIHQLFPALCPSPLHWRASEWMLAKTARRARLILAVSEHTKRDIIEHVGVPDEKIRVTHNALPPDWEDVCTPRPEALERLGNAPYFLYVGNHKRHKNLHLLLEAFAELLTEADGVRLVMTGERKSLDSVLRFLGLGKEVVFLGQLPQKTLPGVYRPALALVFPSHYEGFGYPPLEAMACGVPPIVSDAASLPEVVGDAGLIVPRGDKNALRNAMLRVLREPNLRDDLAEKSKERARCFHWEKLAAETMRAYHDALLCSPDRISA